MAANSSIGSGVAYLLQSYRVPIVHGACSKAGPSWRLHPQGFLHIQLCQLILYILHSKQPQLVCKLAEVMPMTACCLRQEGPRTVSYRATTPQYMNVCEGGGRAEPGQVSYRGTAAIKGAAAPRNGGAGLARIVSQQ